MNDTLWGAFALSLLLMAGCTSTPVAKDTSTAEWTGPVCTGLEDLYATMTGFDRNLGFDYSNYELDCAEDTWHMNAVTTGNPDGVYAAVWDLKTGNFGEVWPLRRIKDSTTWQADVAASEVGFGCDASPTRTFVYLPFRGYDYGVPGNGIKRGEACGGGCGSEKTSLYPDIQVCDDSDAATAFVCSPASGHAAGPVDMDLVSDRDDYLWMIDVDLQAAGLLEGAPYAIGMLATLKGAPVASYVTGF